jgi:hypothetical protein
MALLIEAGQMTASDYVPIYPDLLLASEGASTDAILSNPGLGQQPPTKPTFAALRWAVETGRSFTRRVMATSGPLADRLFSTAVEPLRTFSLAGCCARSGR